MNIPNYKNEIPIEVDLKNNKVGTISAIRNLCACPYPELSDYRMFLISGKLWCRWVEICQEYCISNELIHFFYDSHEFEFQLNEDDLELELHPTLMRVRRWIHLAEKEFEECTKVFTAKLLGKENYSKHYVNKHTSDKKLQRNSSNGNPSLFRFEIQDEFLQTVLDHCLDKFCDQLLNTQGVLKVAMDCGQIVGADNGKLTKYVLMEICVSSQNAHCRPIKSETYFELMTFMMHG